MDTPKGKGDALRSYEALCEPSRQTGNAPLYRPWWPKRGRRCGTLDVILAFKVVGEEIRAKCQRLAAGEASHAEICELARRTKEQRDLVRQIAAPGNAKHVRQLLRHNRKLRRKVVELAEHARLETGVLILR
jgi:hypothetical protein